MPTQVSFDGNVPASLSRRLLRSFPSRRIVVLGDVMLDKFIRGKASRISPEAPVPVVRVTQETLVPGGAGNVVSNLVSLGASVSLVSVVGNDEPGSLLIDELKTRGAETQHVVSDPGRQTTQKVRIVAEHQQVVRVDRESSEHLAADVNRRLLTGLKEALSGAHALILSDYGKGVLSPSVMGPAIAAARARKIPVLVDPKIEHFARYRRVTCLTPNLMEAFGGMRMLPKTDDGAVTALGEKILRKLGSDSVLITRGEHGMTLVETVGRGVRATHIPTQAREVFDVTGAGDTVIAVFGLAVGSGASLREAAAISNVAAGIVVGKLGTATVAPDELASAAEGRRRSAKSVWRRRKPRRADFDRATGKSARRRIG